MRLFVPMDKERLELIVKNLDSLVTALKSEIYSDGYAQPKEPIKMHERLGVVDYDEIFDENEYQD